jgi:hypothetical protein
MSQKQYEEYFAITAMGIIHIKNKKVFIIILRMQQKDLKIQLLVYKNGLIKLILLI